MLCLKPFSASLNNFDKLRKLKGVTSGVLRLLEPSCTSSGSTPNSLVIRLLMEFCALKFQAMLSVLSGSNLMFLQGFWRFILIASSGSNRLTSLVTCFWECLKLADILKGVPANVLL